MAPALKEKLEQLLDMGYENYETNIKALSMTRGNLDKAIELILENSD